MCRRGGGGEGCVSVVRRMPAKQEPLLVLECN